MEVSTEWLDGLLADVHNEEFLPRNRLQTVAAKICLAMSADPAPAPPSPAASCAVPQGRPRPMDTAPRDGTMLMLLVDPNDPKDSDSFTPFEDSTDPGWTIGFNSLDNTGEDHWQFAGWNWEQDMIIDGAGTPIGWLPFDPTGAAASPALAPEQLRDASALAGSIGGGGVPFLNTADMADLERVEDCFADGEGYDVTKERMQRLAELGVVRRHHGSHYSITSFGRWVLGNWRQLPLETVEEANARSHAEMAARNGIGALSGPDNPSALPPSEGGAHV